MKTFTRRSIGWGACVLLMIAAGCSGPPEKAEIEKRVRANLTAASADWKDIKFEMKANDTVCVVLTSRTLNGKNYEYSCTSGTSTDGAGVAVRRSGSDWLAKYRYENGKEIDSTKMTGTEEDVKDLRPSATELATVVAKACR